jgi:hypothetical protein
MVSNTLKMDLQELLDTLQRLRRDHAGSPDYQAIRRELPEDWPI